ncbi:MAG: KilA-N domain-containing protein [Rhodospirillaceae bacterium]|nr:KilA-N domain-containing protein [Rhodospirillaceae bacterium]
MAAVRCRTKLKQNAFPRIRTTRQHRRITAHLGAYAGEMAWREDHRRMPNGSQFNAVIGAAMALPVSRQWAGYWQREAVIDWKLHKSQHSCRRYIASRTMATDSTPPRISLLLVQHEIERDVIPQRVRDGYIDATSMCRAAGKMMKNMVSLLVASTLVLACASTAPMTPPAGERPPQYTTRQNVEVTDSNFEQVVTFAGIEAVEFNDTVQGVPDDRYWLSSLVERNTGLAAHRVILLETYVDDWRFYNRATDDQAVNLDFVLVERGVLSCSGRSPHCHHFEVVSAVLPDGYLRSRQSGFSVQFASRTGDRLVVDIAPAMISAQLAAVDHWRQSNL